MLGLVQARSGPGREERMLDPADCVCLLQDPRTVAHLSLFCQEVLERIDREDARWKESWTKELDVVKRQMEFLKKDGERRVSELKKELTDWLKQELQTRLGQDRKSVVLHPELQGALEGLEKRLLQRLSQEEHKQQGDLWRILGESLQKEELAAITVKPEVHPGRCWAFEGTEGFITIALSYPVCVTHVTLEHIPKSLSPTGRIDSATRDFAIYGWSGCAELEEGDILGRFTYDSDGEPIQTFQLQLPLRVLSNWGNPEYTCIYRFRVHSQKPLR
ncbi:hypothetical protein ACEWY4_011568 [Coilia grayii]|uniref:SUN domain-containing protein n=1 Tax=Coilia grayii TaxID=363190 RepID=A0ABD1JY55_9TELE